MKYIAIFDLPEGKDIYNEEDFENVYAQIEPLSEPTALN